MSGELEAVRQNRETVRSEIGNALQILQDTKAFAMSPSEVEIRLGDVEARLYAALNLLKEPT